MKIDVTIPSVGESVTEATIGQWHVKNGDRVSQNQVLLSLETDKASVEVTAEKSGQIEILTPAGSVIPIGAVVARIDTSASASEMPKVTENTKGQESMPEAKETISEQVGVNVHLSPAVQRVVTQHGLDPAQIVGTGPKGRLTKEDALRAVAQKEVPKEISIKNPEPSSSPSPRQTRTPMSHIRKRIAERLVFSQQSTATLTTFNEIDMSRVMEIRQKYKEKFKEKYQVNLGFMGFFAKAAIEALKTWPQVNAFIDGNDIVFNHFINLGIAVGTDKGLMVPVIKNADQMSIAQIEIAIRDFAQKAREGRISVDDLQDGTFTISNGGVYGSLMSTPILNPPQTGILGLHKIEDRPVVINGQIVIRPMMYVALSYDHRMIDGREAVSFLVKIKECMEDPERMLLEI
ncbi:MAG: 2-oxoglutarate dehydrogenase complex dihydrolipoyllysine-residue succinyltransferase [Bdellovibrionaceae bacterium]|nr:2-oxoglutarate dehydrogenase complex dihydrolipoyllysine-residue succinyltransferase [Pseudobdellovibrionaceae bacterium]MDW8189719.1 2-oxoglutarate dehydrogenase complex dihydrolipoyllysine-residue succinyltransferase [Pseudobdellovibrionaceae bacterium]